MESLLARENQEFHLHQNLKKNFFNKLQFQKKPYKFKKSFTNIKIWVKQMLRSKPFFSDTFNIALMLKIIFCFFIIKLKNEAPNQLDILKK